MNCDDVFDRITSGGADAENDPAVESHLARCARCRSLVEALTPALGLFREAEIEEGSAASAGFVVPTQNPSRRGAVRRGVRGGPLQATSEGISRGALLRMAAAVVLGVALGAAVPGWEFDAGRETATPAIGARADLLPGGGTLSAGLFDGGSLAGSLGLAVACLNRALPAEVTANARQPAPESTALADLKCCSDCHSSLVEGIQHDGMALAKVAQSCKLCHN